MAFSINSFGDNLFRALYSNSLLGVLGLAEEERQAADATSNDPSLLLTQELLHGFSFSLNEVRRVFNLADAFQSFTGQGNQQLTQQEIRFYLDYIQKTPTSALPEKEELLILLLLNHYFDQLADISILSDFGHYRAISIQLLERLASADGNPKDITFHDIELFLQKKAEQVQSNLQSEMRNQELHVTYHASERQQAPFMKKESLNRPKVYQPLVEMVHTPNEVQVGKKLELEEANDLVLKIQIFSFSVKEILLLVHAEKGPIRLAELEKTSKIVESYLLDLERLMQTLMPGNQSSANVSKALLAKQLEQARRSAYILRILKQHFNEIAEVDGDNASISKEDIEHLACLDGQVDNLTQEDLKNLRKQKRELNAKTDAV